MRVTIRIITREKTLRPAEDAPIKLIDLGHWKFQSGEQVNIEMDEGFVMDNLGKFKLMVNIVKKHIVYIEVIETFDKTFTLHIVYDHICTV